MQRLMDENIIRIGASTNPFALGYEGVATLGLKCDIGKVLEVAEAIATYKQVQYVGIYASPYDIVSWVVFRKLSDLGHFTKVELSRIPGLREVETIVNFKLVKMLFRAPI
jgi:Lrp/AsnC family transcriptional regulator for asnA, asnC and gidA